MPEETLQIYLLHVLIHVTRPCFNDFNEHRCKHTKRTILEYNTTITYKITIVM